MATTNGTSPDPPYNPATDPIYGNQQLRPYQRETRVVHLLPGRWNDEIRCELRIVGLGAKPKFEAVSYVWGEFDDPPLTILLNGHPHKVTSNLKSALRHFRSTTVVRKIWVDGLGINQQDKKERGQQVDMMRLIYEKCDGVLVWLGEAVVEGRRRIAQQGDDGENTCAWSTDFREAYSAEHHIDANQEDKDKIKYYMEGFKTFHRRPIALKGRLTQDHILGAFCLISLLAQNKHLNDNDIPFFLAHLSRQKIVESLSGIMNKTWWGRQWVIQETVLAPKATVYYGRFQAPWDMFTIAAKNYLVHRQGCCSNQYAQLPPEDVEGVAHFARTVLDVDDWRQVWWQRIPPRVPRIPLLPLLWQFRRRKTTNPKDKVFALLPLVTEWRSNPTMHANYEMTDAEAYHTTVVELMSVHDSLLVLMGNAEKSVELKDQLPSWVPDWTVKPHCNELQRLERALLYTAAGSTTPDERFIDGRFLELNGIAFDTVTFVGDAMPCDDDALAADLFPRWEDMAGIPTNSLAQYIGGKQIFEAYWRTLCMDTVYTGKETDNENLPLDKKNYERAGRGYGRKWNIWNRDTTTQNNTYTGSEDDFEIIRGLESRTTTTMFAWLDDENSDRPDNRGVTSPTPRERAQNLKNEAILIDIAIKTATTDQKFFRTHKQYMGLGPKTMMPNDKVFVLHGGNTPFVLRIARSYDVPEVGERSCYELIGDCYVHGLMDGQAMDAGIATEKVYLI